MKSITAITTYMCNLNCSFCILRDVQKYPMDPEKFLATVEKFCAKHRGIDLHIMGGEPLLFPALVNDLAFIGKKYDMSMGVFSNGILWDQDYTAWANANGIGATFSVHSMFGEKPITNLDIKSIRGVNNKMFTKVTSPGEEWAEFVWMLRNLFDCKVNVSIDVHQLKDMTVERMATFVREYEKLGRPDWIELIGMTAKECSCAKHGMIEPDGTFMTRAAYIGEKAYVSKGCARIERKMGKENYELIRKLLGVM